MNIAQKHFLGHIYTEGSYEKITTFSMLCNTDFNHNINIFFSSPNMLNYDWSHHNNICKHWVFQSQLNYDWSHHHNMFDYYLAGGTTAPRRDRAIGWKHF